MRHHLSIDQRLALKTAATQLDDPAGQGLDAVRPIRDEIERGVRKLLDELDAPVSA